MFKNREKSVGKNCSQSIALQVFMQRARIEVHWISQNWQFGNVSQRSRHSLIQQLQQGEKNLKILQDNIIGLSNKNQALYLV